MLTYSLDTWPRVEHQDYVVVIFLVFQGTSILIPTVAILIYVHTTVCKGCFSPTSYPAFFTFFFYDGTNV
jgi:hypothetical protein